MKIIDCFTFYNELELLFFKLSLLYDYVDYFILIESNVTFSGKDKPLYYKENMHLYEKFNDKIIHIVIDLPFKYPNINYEKNEQWENEKNQRNGVSQCLQKYNIELESNDLLIIADVDEIINPSILRQLKNGEILLYNGFSLKQDLYYYNINCKNTWFWSKAKIVSYEYFLKKTPEDIRNENLPLLENSGWHLSYFGNTEFIKNKLEGFSHQEYNQSYFTNEEYIKNKIDNSIDLFGRDFVEMTYIPICSNGNLPPLYDPYLLKFTNNKESNIISDIPIYMYYHICCISNWKEIITRMLFKLKHSGLYDLIKEIRCTVLGEDYDPEFIFFKDPKIKVRLHSTDVNIYERACLNGMNDDALNENFYVLYSHSKGVKHYQSPYTHTNVYNWCEYMHYFTIYKYRKCIEELNNGADAVGCNLQECGAPLHYSGNFWWSKSSHISKLPKIVDNYYNTPEFWVTSISGTYSKIWASTTHHYNDPYPANKYEGKQIDTEIITKS
jgi:beta-1,4-mannosyl-glycoprotein beta-1,4-N-acetylglucosaminyltransferase